MTKLCPRGKAAAKSKIKDPSGVKRKDFKGRKPSAMGGRIMKASGGLTEATARLKRQGLKNGGKVARGCGAIMSNRKKVTKMYA